MGFTIPSLRVNLPQQSLNLQKHRLIVNRIYNLPPPSSSLPLTMQPFHRSLKFTPKTTKTKATLNGRDSFIGRLRNRVQKRVSDSDTAQCSGDDENEEEIEIIKARNENGGKIAVGSAVTVVLAVLNRVLYKLALVPMKEYPFFMAQLTTFGYVAIYFSILYARYHAGVVTQEMIDLPKILFIAIGILEALGLAAGMAAGAMLPGPAIPILHQTFLVWQLIFSFWILGRKFSFSQTFGCLLVAAGVIFAVSSGVNDASSLSEMETLWPALMIASSALQAGASILKEFVFIDASKRLKGKPLDIFVVNSFGSGFQALFVLLFLPLLSNLKGIPFSELPSYLRSGAGCFLNMGAEVSGCEGAPLLPLLYIAVNMAFNISLLYLVKISSAVVSSLAATLAVPLSIYVLTLPLPYIPQGDNLSPYFVIGSAVLVLGLVMYNLPRSSKESS